MPDAVHSSVENGVQAPRIQEGLQPTIPEQPEPSAVRRTFRGIGNYLNRVRGKAPKEALETIASSDQAEDSQEKDIEKVPFDEEKFDTLRREIHEVKFADERDDVSDEDVDRNVNSVLSSLSTIHSGLDTPGFEGRALITFNELINSGNPQFRAAGVQLIDQNFQTISERIQDPANTGYDVAEALSCVSVLWQSGTSEQKQRSIEFLRQNIQLIRERSKKAGDYTPVMRALLEAEVPEVLEIIHETITDPRKLLHEKTKALAITLTAQDQNIRAQGELMLNELFKERLETDVSQELTTRLLRAWHESTTIQDSEGNPITDKRVLEENFFLNLNANISHMTALENEENGSIQTLESEFGIRNFARYSDMLLLKQFRERNDTILRYVAVTSALYDHNGAFSYPAGVVLDSLMDGLGTKYSLRVVEAGTNASLITRLSDLDKRYGASSKMGGLIVRAHGEKEKIEFGKHADALTVANIKKYTTERIKNFFFPKAPFLFISCETGQETGIAGQAAESFDVHAVAPEESTNIESITPVMDENGRLLELIGKYHSGKALSYAGSRQSLSSA